MRKVDVKTNTRLRNKRKKFSTCDILFVPILQRFGNI